MPHFLISSNNIIDKVLTVSDKDTIHHLVNVLRIKVGEKLKFIDENQIQYETKILKASKNELQAEIYNSYKSNRSLKFEIHLAISVLKNDAQNLAISNAVQLGVKSIIPLMTDNSTMKAQIADLKSSKWQKIADEAFKQCERADLAIVEDTCSLQSVIKNFKHDNIIVFAEREHNVDLKDAVKTIDEEDKILVIIGPEGGFSDREFEFFKENNLKMATLGNLILKAPNAVTAGLSNTIFALEIGV